MKIKKMVSDVPELIRFWGHNPDLDPSEIPASKSMKVNWKCPDCGYEWVANIHTKYYDGTGCPACAGKVATPTRNALVSYPELKRFYVVAPDNPKLEELLPTSSKKVRWKCPDCGHEWKQSIVDRVRDGKVRGCSICTGAKIKGTYKDEYPEVAKIYSDKNDKPFEKLNSYDRKTTFLWNCEECGYEFKSTLGSMIEIINRPNKGCPKCLGKIVPKVGESVADKFPELLKEVDGEIDLTQYLPNSKKVVKWKCGDCGFIYEATIQAKTSGNGKCPVCNKTKPVKEVNSLQDLFVEVSKQWSPNNKTTPDKVYSDATTTFEWVCDECGMTFNAKTKDMADGTAKCPYCNGYFAKPEESISYNYPELLDYWDYDENASSPDLIHSNSAGTYNWKCSDGHKFKMKVKVASEYFENGTEICPYCDDRRTPEEKSFYKLYPELNRFWREPEIANNISPDSTRQYKWECDKGHLYNLSVADMVRYSENNEEPCPYCSGRLVISDENSFKAVYPELVKYWDYEANKEDQNNDGPENVFADSLSAYFFKCDEGHSYRKTPVQMVYEEENGIEHCPYCANRKPLKGYNTVEDKNPELLDFWEDERFDPDEITYTSKQVIMFRCPDCGGHFRSDIQDFAEGEYDCPYCNDRKPLKGLNTIEDRYPEISEVWADEDFKIDETLYTNNYPVRIKCPECGGVYKEHIQNIIDGNYDCPYCNDRRVYPGVNSFKVKRPDLMKEWDELANLLLIDADEVSEKSNRIAWWECSKGHNYKMSIVRRVMFDHRHMTACPYCKGLKQKHTLTYRFQK